MVFRILAVVLVLVMSGCAAQQAAVENLTNSTTDINESEDLVTGGNVVVPEVEISDSERERRLRAKGFGLLDLNRLTKENCPGFLDVFEQRLVNEKEELREIIEQFDRRQQSLDDAQEVYDQSVSSGDEYSIERAKEDLDAAQDLFDQAEDELEEQEELVRKIDLLLKEMNTECKRLEGE